MARAVVVLLALVLVAGGPASGMPAADPPVLGVRGTGGTAEGASEGLTLRLRVVQRQFRAGMPVRAELEVRNERATPVTLIVAPFHVFDLVVYDLRGFRIWAWSNRPSPLVPPGRRTLEAGEALRGQVVWDSMTRLPGSTAATAAPSGTYRLEGGLHALILEAPRLMLRTTRLTIFLAP